MIVKISVVLLSWLCGVGAFAATYQVGSIADLNAKISIAVAGDTIIVSNGVYSSSSSIAVNKAGTAASPITIRAQTIGGVEITGAKGFSLNSPAAYITIQGFKFTHAGNIVINSGTSHCRFTRNFIQLTINPTNETSYININGDDVQIDYNELCNKSTLGEMLDIAGSGSQVARRLWVHHNYFHDFSSPGGNGAETIRWGLSGLSLSTGSGLCEFNLFVRCEGENEMISNKSSGNTYRYNTVRDCVGGQISQRHGNDCLYYGNYMTNTDGIRVFGDRHKIFSNYLENNSTGVNMGNGDGDVYNGAALTAHDRPDDNVVEFNTFINNSTHYEMQGRTGGLGSSNTIVANNIFQGGGSMASISTSGPYTGTWTNNIRWQTSSAGNMPSSGYVTENPLLARDTSGSFHLQAGSPAINAGVNAFNFYGVQMPNTNFSVDMDGQARDASLDIGADEVSAAPIIAHILTTNDVGMFAGLANQLSVSPLTQSVKPGLATAYTANFQGASSASAISLTVSGLPANTTAAFSPVSLTNAGISTLTVTTAGNTPLGNYVLTIIGAGGGLANTNTVTLIVSTNTLALPGTLVWTALAGADKAWNTAQNWTNIINGGTGTPGAANDIVFTNIGTVSGQTQSNNIVDATFAGQSGVIQSLQYADSNNVYQVTAITTGQTLTISNNATGKALLVGTASDNGSNASASVNAVITGADGELDVLAPSGFFSVSQGGGAGSNPTGAQRAMLDMSGLGTFTAIVSNMYVGVREGAGLTTRACGVLYLARENSITATGTGSNAILVADNGSGNGSGLASGIYLGLENDINADAIIIGRQKAPNGAFLKFNPAFISAGPEAVIRGNSDTRVALYAVGDASLLNTTQSSLGTNDFSGGNVDLQVDVMVLGRGALSTGTGAGGGILAFDNGDIDVNTLQAGYQNGSTSPAAGVINVTGSDATLVINSNLLLAHANGGSAEGTLNIQGGTVNASSITAGGGVSSIVMNGGWLAISNFAGTPAAPLTTLAATNSTLQFELNGLAITTNVVATTLSASGINQMVIDSAAGVTATTTFPLITYTTFNGSVADNFVVAGLPAGVNGGLVNDAARKTIDLVLTPLSNSVPVIATVSFSGGNISLHGSNGSPYGTYRLLATTNLPATPDQWTVVSASSFDSAGNFNIQAGIDPSLPGQFFMLVSP